MTKARITRVSTGFYKNLSPHPEAILVDEGRVFTNTGMPITHWEIEINSLEDLARIADDEDVVVAFGKDGSISSVKIYDDYME